MRTPLQGGLPPVGAVDGAVVEIACDESGFSGTNLLDPAMPVITHASVDLSPDEAVALIRELRTVVPANLPSELKSGKVLRRPGVLEWFLGALQGRSHVLVVDKEFFLVTRVVDLFLGEPSYAAGTRLAGAHPQAALALYEAGRSAGGDWHVFLRAFIHLVRAKRRRPPRESVAEFTAARDALIHRGAGTVLDGVTTERVWDVVTRLDNDDRSLPPPLEPLLPALAETVLHWSGEQGRRVLVTHDEQSALTADRLTRLQRALARDGRPSPLAGLVMADSRDDPRVQIADLLAGAARRTPRGWLSG
ncbi:hypothetical protein Ade02nite_02420 [Paractinoplanes deccanensis]|uniref:DUF3800 domain-containing protein n=1 Tax=Paractinoplanes deccanensis TaxID=113561 RepID=A0ABQ3XV36_9ACTN|nr:hypothetical protein [Actinoplanes deccanensis]GID71601.1 hypothetical protein Ade02nite_02420 [Actinoplanes deccanensis]